MPSLKNKPCFLALMVFLPLISCADKQDNHGNNKYEEKTTPIPAKQIPINQAESLYSKINENSGRILSAKKLITGKIAVEMLFPTPPADRSEMTELIIQGLKAAKADPGFLSAIQSRLIRNRRLDQESFELNLKGLDGEEYLVIYASNLTHNNYRLGIQH